MHLKHLQLINFRNFEKASFDFSSNLMAVTGPNGIGKTNLLDAIHYCSMLRSHLVSKDERMIKEGLDFFSILAEVDNGEKQKLLISHQPGKKKLVKLNGKECERLADHIGRFPLIMIAPADINLLRDSSERRRRFLDAFLSQMDPDYISQLQIYKRLLNQRNALLKSYRMGRSMDFKLLEIITSQMESPMDLIYTKRKSFLTEFAKPFENIYSKITSSKEEKPRLSLESLLNEGTAKEVFQSHLQADLAAGRTTAGIHKDDLLFTLNGQKAKDFASQGQKKSLIFAVKLAQYHSLRSELGKAPILILDDLFEKLDKNRISSLLALVSSKEYGQLFISDTDKERVSEILTKHKLQFQLIEIN